MILVFDKFKYIDSIGVYGYAKDYELADKIHGLEMNFAMEEYKCHIDENWCTEKSEFLKSEKNEYQNEYDIR